MVTYFSSPLHLSAYLYVLLFAFPSFLSVFIYVLLNGQIFENALVKWHDKRNDTNYEYSLVIVIKAVGFFEFDASVTREKRKVSAHV